jgi:DNA replication protein DnaC
MKPARVVKGRHEQEELRLCAGHLNVPLADALLWPHHDRRGFPMSRRGGTPVLRLKYANLRQSAVVEDLDTTTARGLDRVLFAKLASREWIGRRQDLLITGKTGAGKSWLACALGHTACRHDRSVLYHRVPRLLDAIALARGDGRYPRLLRSLARVELLIDDWGLAPLTSQQGRDLLDIVDDRHGRGSTIVTSQIPVKHWHELLADPTAADAVLDRLVHTSHRIELGGPSLRDPKTGNRREPTTASTQAVASLTHRSAREPMKPSMGAPCPQSSQCCPHSIRITVRNRSQLLSAMVGILHIERAEDCDRAKSQ